MQDVQRTATRHWLSAKSLAKNYTSPTPFIVFLVLVLFLCEHAAVAWTVVRHGPTLRKMESMGTPSSMFGQSNPRLQPKPVSASRLQPLHLKSAASSAGDDEYKLEPNSDPRINSACRFTQDQILTLISKRLDCRKNRNFANADKILQALNQNGIYLQDKARKYRVDGENHFGRRQHYVQRGATTVPPEELAVVQDLVEDRARCKRKRDYRKSDQITSQLKDQYGVKVNDKRREWSFVENEVATATTTTTTTENASSANGYYVPTPLAPQDHPTHTMALETQETIRNRLGDRSVARNNKQYKLADAILQELMNQYSIVVDDRTKEWKVVSDEDSFFDSEHDSFVQEAKLSRRSAFVQARRKTSVLDRRHDETIHTKWKTDRDVSNRNDSTAVPLSVDEELSRVFRNEKETSDNDDDDTLLSTNAASAALNDETRKGIETANEEKEATSLDALTVAVLKEKLRSAGLPVSGRKSELIHRLLSAS